MINLVLVVGTLHLGRQRIIVKTGIGKGDDRSFAALAALLQKKNVKDLSFTLFPPPCAATRPLAAFIKTMPEKTSLHQGFKDFIAGGLAGVV